jgi:anaerobic ribonucleoside-triphosphate reductase activating protein
MKLDQRITHDHPTNSVSKAGHITGAHDADDTDSAAFLTVSRFEPRTMALGPGERAVIWFHGCSFNCHGCIAAEMNASAEFAQVPVERLMRTVAAIPDIEGVTLSGGDPFDQNIESLALLLEQLRACSPLSVMCYTGRTLAQLRTGAKAAAHDRVLANVDVLVDGLYVDSLNDGRAWRGSSNQQVHFLTPRYRHLENSVSSSTDRKLEVTLDRSGRLRITGIPPSGFLGRLGQELTLRGLTISTPSKGASYERA